MEAKKRKVSSLTVQQEGEDGMEVIDEVNKVPQASSATPAPKRSGQSSTWVSDRSVDVCMQVHDPATGNLLVKPVKIPTNLASVAKFFHKHNKVLKISSDSSYSVVPMLGQTSLHSPFQRIPNMTTMARPLFKRPPTVAARCAGSRAMPSPLSVSPRPLFPMKGFAALPSGPRPSSSETIVKLPTLSATASATRRVPASVKIERRPLRNSSSKLEKAPKKGVATGPVNVSKLESRGTLWGIVAPVDLVFARWDDGLFYSGKVKCPGGPENSWKITFDDGLEQAVSDSDIIPIRILGSGTAVNYPAGSLLVRPRDAMVVGQQIELNHVVQSFSVNYAIKFEGEEQLIWATRDELCFGESTAITLRRWYACARAGTEGHQQGTTNGSRTRVNKMKKELTQLNWKE